MQNWLDTIEICSWLGGFTGGITGAFLVISASFFIDIGLRLKPLAWYLKILFLFSGGVTAAVFDIQFEIDFIYAVAVGGAWPYVAKALKSGAETYVKGKRLELLHHGKIDELLREAERQITKGERNARATNT